MKTITFLLFCSFMALGSAITGAEVAGERIEYDPSTGNYLVWYEVDGVLEATVFEPSTKIYPEVAERIQTGRALLTYHYMIENGGNSEQPIDVITFSESSVWENLQVPSGWKGQIAENPQQRLMDAGVVYWGTEEVGGLKPGDALSFSHDSPDLPGVGVIRLHGATPILRFKGYGVGPEVQEELDALRDPEKNSVARFTILPLIKAPQPFDAVQLLDGMVSHIEALTSAKRLDTVFANQLTGHLNAASDAFARENTPGAMQNLGAATELLMSSDSGTSKGSADHEITELLAKAFRFNIKYIHMNVGIRGQYP